MSATETATADTTEIAAATAPFAPITEAERGARIASVGQWAETLRAQPERGALKFSVAGEAAGSVGSVFHAGEHRLVVDEPAALAGDGLAANPVEYALTALLSCQVVTYRVWAANLGIAVDTIEAAAVGDIDVRGFLGIDDSVRPGFSGVRVEVTVSGPETEARYRELEAAVQTHCPVLDLFANATPVETSLTID